MKYSLILLLIINIGISLCRNLADQEPTLLKGTPISSDKSSKTLENAFDGDFTTEYKATSESYGWIGLKLESSYRITKIGWGQKKGGEKTNYLLGVFEGANNETFYDAVPIYMITEEGKDGEINYAKIDVTRPFKYVRYVGPSAKNSVISVLEFYGDKADENKEIEEKLYQPTNLPLVVVRTENGVLPVDKENGIICQVETIKDHKVDIKGSGNIKLRGNSTRKLEKSPYKFKFDEKIRILGLPSKAKKWNLMANHADKSLLRTLVGLKVGSLFEMDYVPACTPVDVIVNGEYKGNYNLCDKVEYGKNRVELAEMNETCIKEPEITGGYLLEASHLATKNEIYGKTNKGISYSIRYPSTEDIKSEQFTYITDKMNEIEEEVYSGKVDSIDFNSLSKLLLSRELCGAAEMMASTYMTKERNDDKIRFGPIWDFDGDFDNDSRVYPTLEKKNFIFKYGTSSGTMVDFVTKILSNEDVLKFFKKMWEDMTKTKVTKEIIDSFIEKEIDNIYESQRLNFMRYDVTKKTLASPLSRGSFIAEADYLREYMQKRFDFLDELVKNATTTSVSEEVKSNRVGGGGDHGGPGGHHGGN